MDETPRSIFAQMLNDLDPEDRISEEAEVSLLIGAYICSLLYRIAVEIRDKPIG